MDDRFVFLRSNYLVKKVDINDILYVNIKDQLTAIYLSTGDVFFYSKPLCEILKEVPAHFIYISRNWMININRINEINLKIRTVTMEDGKQLPISVRKFKILKKKLI